MSGYENNGVFVTGTDTDVGKTYIASGILKAVAGVCPAVGFKPVASGAERDGDGWIQEDVDALQAVASLKVPDRLMNPFVFEPPIAPHIAAADLGLRLTVAQLEQAYRDLRAEGPEFVVAEGAGGWCVPLNETETIADLAKAIGLPVVLVVGIKLGCINHSILTANQVLRDGCRLVGWVANFPGTDVSREHEQIETLEQKLPCPLLATVAYGEVPAITANQVQAVCS